MKFGRHLISDEPELLWPYSLVPALLCKKSGNKQQEVSRVHRGCFPSFPTVPLLKCTLIFPYSHSDFQRAVFHTGIPLIGLVSIVLLPDHVSRLLAPAPKSVKPKHRSFYHCSLPLLLGKQHTRLLCLPFSECGLPNKMLSIHLRTTLHRAALCWLVKDFS